MSQTITIEEVIARIGEWRDKKVRTQQLSIGMTNKNYRVQAGEQAYFVRIPGKATELLSINRKNERYNTLAAGETGVSPRVLYYLEPESVMVLEYIDAETMSVQSLQSDEAITKIARSLRMLHSGRSFMRDFNIFRLREFYIDVVRKHGVRIPDDYSEYEWVAIETERAMAAQPSRYVPCHNDLLAENFMDGSGFMWIIDYEYSGNNDCSFELGNICTEMEYSQPQVGRLCEEYFGEISRSKVARVRLYSVMSDVVWTLWGAIQNKMSDIDFDFWAYAMNRWNRAKKNLRATEFRSWLRDVTVEG